jgi:SAM-dependent methyltransferase
MAELGESFDTVLDCGLFHLFRDADQAAYVAGLHRVLRPGGRYFMLGFSEREPGDWPHKLRRDDITAAFTDGWRIDSIEPATIEARLDSGGVLAWRAALTRL